MWLAECCSFRINIKIIPHQDLHCKHNTQIKKSKATDKPSSSCTDHLGHVWRSNTLWSHIMFTVVWSAWGSYLPTLIPNNIWTQLSVDLWLCSLLLVTLSCVELEFRDKLDWNHSRIRWRMWSLHMAHHHHFGPFNAPLGLIVKYKDYIFTKQIARKLKNSPHKIKTHYELTSADMLSVHQTLKYRAINTAAHKGKWSQITQRALN